LPSDDLAANRAQDMLPAARALFKPVRGRLAAYSLAVLFAVLAIAVRFAADHLLPPGFPFLTFFPAVIIAAFLGGRGPGALCATISLLASWFYFIPPFESFELSAPVATALLFFTAVVVVDIWLIDGLQQRQTRLEENQHQLAAMADQQTLLFKELQHRVANNLASVSSMLRLQRRQIERDPASAMRILESADSRIELMGRVHRQLYDPAARELALPEQIENVVRHAQDVAAASHVTIEVNAVNARIAMDRMMTLMLLITEVLNNSIKHAFAAGDPGEVQLSLERIGSNRLRLIIADNGKGFDSASGNEAPRHRGLGTTIIKGFVSQLGGELTTDGSNGVTTAVEFPEDAD
jgi:two-component sensor histidine kinase